MIDISYHKTDLYGSIIQIRVFNGNSIVQKYYLADFNFEHLSSFNIMQEIPGTRIGYGASSFGDYNGDGIDEIFRYGFGGNGYFISIRGYDAEKDGLVLYCSIPFEILDKDHGPAPVEFLTYNGVYGFKVYFSQPNVAGGPVYIPGESD